MGGKGRSKAVKLCVLVAPESELPIVDSGITIVAPNGPWYPGLDEIEPIAALVLQAVEAASSYKCFEHDYLNWFRVRVRGNQVVIQLAFDASTAAFKQTPEEFGRHQRLGSVPMTPSQARAFTNQLRLAGLRVKKRVNGLVGTVSSHIDSSTRLQDALYLARDMFEAGSGQKPMSPLISQLEITSSHMAVLRRSLICFIHRQVTLVDKASAMFALGKHPRHRTLIELARRVLQSPEGSDPNLQWQTLIALDNWGEKMPPDMWGDKQVREQWLRDYLKPC